MFPTSPTTRPQTTICTDGPGTGGNGNGKCNNISDKKINDFADLKRDRRDRRQQVHLLDRFEYRFPISETIGLQGVAFFDTGNAFDEDEYNLFDVTKWRYGTGVGRAVVLAVRPAGGGDRLPARPALGREIARLRVLRGRSGFLTRTRLRYIVPGEGQGMQDPQGLRAAGARRAARLGHRGAGRADQDRRSSTSTRRSAPPTRARRPARSSRASSARPESRCSRMIGSLQGRSKTTSSKKFVLSDEALFQKQLDLAEMRNLIQNKMQGARGPAPGRPEAPRGAAHQEARRRSSRTSGKDAGLHADPAPRHAGAALHARSARHHRPDHQALQPEGLRRAVPHVHPTAVVDPRREARRRRRGRPARDDRRARRARVRASRSAPT